MVIVYNKRVRIMVVLLYVLEVWCVKGILFYLYCNFMIIYGKDMYGFYWENLISYFFKFRK